MRNLVYKNYTEEEKIKEIAALASLMILNTFQEANHNFGELHGGQVGLVFDYADWAREFFDANLETVWEKTKEPWRDTVITFARQKIYFITAMSRSKIFRRKKIKLNK